MRTLGPIKPVLWALIWLPLFPGCNNNDEPADPQLVGELYLSKIFVDGEIYREIGYDEEKRIETITDYEDGELTGSSVREYDENGRVKIRWSLDAEGDFQVAHAYEYQNGKLVQTLVYPDLFDDPTYATSYEYDDEGRVSATYHFVPSDPETIQTYTRNEYDSYGNLSVQRNFQVMPTGPDVMYYEEFRGYVDPQRTSMIREKIGGTPSALMYLYSSTEVTNYDNGGSGDIDFKYTVDVEISYDEKGWPERSTVSALQTHPQYHEGTVVMTYEYVEL